DRERGGRCRGRRHGVAAGEPALSDGIVHHGCGPSGGGCWLVPVDGAEGGVLVMVDAFEASGAGRVRSQLTDVPSARDPHVVSVDQLTRPYQAIAEAVGHLGQGLSRAADDIAAYNAMAHQTAFAEAQVQIDKDAAQARADYRGRPAEFEAWSKEYARTVGKESPILRDKLRTYATRVLGNEFAGLVGEKRRHDEQTALATLKARRDDVESKLEDMVFRGADRNPDG